MAGSNRLPSLGSTHIFHSCIFMTCFIFFYFEQCVIKYMHHDLLIYSLIYIMLILLILDGNALVISIRGHFSSFLELLLRSTINDMAQKYRLLCFHYFENQKSQVKLVRNVTFAPKALGKIHAMHFLSVLDSPPPAQATCFQQPLAWLCLLASWPVVLVCSHELPLICCSPSSPLASK